MQKRNSEQILLKYWLRGPAKIIDYLLDLFL